MVKLKISTKAKEDLAEIKGCISQELSNPQAAVNLVSKITKKIRRLSEYPGIGAPLSSVIDIQTDYHFLVCANYLIFYRCEWFRRLRPTPNGLVKHQKPLQPIAVSEARKTKIL
ncbi:type II toxin-antitoxin system RelE/ParE family toxin [Ferviditalea candida]|uniref:type II toxin-antitoxin system RelE/ParE family toxin n=1 Tax=Ferviditalea candida TaxID=3108399 RepID=UPI00352D0282